MEQIVKTILGLLEGFLTGMATKDALASAGASPDSIQGAATTRMDLPSFHTEPSPPAGVPESRELAHAHPELVRRYLLIKADFYQQTGRQLFETCTWRSKERQAELYAQGRTAPGKIVTKVDGVTSRSRHNFFPSQAVDVCVDSDPGPGKHPVWDPAAYQPLAQLCIIHGLVWGGDWNSNGSSADERFIDFPHLELPAGLV